MSGIEIAGLVLAVFPVVVSGLKAYAEGIETVKTWRRYRRELDGYKRQLETQRVWYLDTLEELLVFVDSEEELAELIREPGGLQWQRPEHATKLRERLDHSYDSYLAIISELLQTLQVVKKKLCINANGKVRALIVWYLLISLRMWGSLRLPMSFQYSVNIQDSSPEGAAFQMFGGQVLDTHRRICRDI